MAKLSNSVLCIVTYSFKLTRLSSTTAWSADRGGGQCGILAEAAHRPLTPKAVIDQLRN